MGKSTVDQYLEDRKKRLDAEKKGNTGTISGKSDAVKQYLSQREEDGRTKKSIKKGVSSFNSQKDDYGIGFKPSYDKESFAREYAARRLQNKVASVKTVPQKPMLRDSQKPYTKMELTSMVEEFRQRSNNSNHTLRNDPYTRSEYIAKGAAIKNPEIGNNPVQNFKMLYNTPFGNPVKNKVEYAFDAIDNGAIEEQKKLKEGDSDPNYKKNIEPYLHMTETEREEYNFLFGKYGESEADKYLKGLRNTLNAREADAQYQELDNRKILHKTNKALASLGAQNKESIMNMTKGVASMLTGKGADENEISVDDYLASMIQNNAEGGEKVLYQAAGSIGNMIPSMEVSILNPLAGKFAFGMSAAGGAYESAISEGKDIDKAQDYALFNGMTETMTQALLGGISGLSGKYLQKAVAKSGAAKAAQEGIKRFVSNPTARKAIMGTANYAGDMASEGMEEYIQELMDKSARNILFDEDNEIKLSDPDAWYAALLGSVTAGVLNAPGAFANAQSGRWTMENNKDFSEPQEERIKTESIPEPPLLQAAHEFAARNGVEISQRNTRDLQRMGSLEGVETDTNKTGDEIYNISDNRQETPVKMSNDRTDIKELFTSIGENGQKAAADNYDGSVEMINYQSAFNRYYDAGRYNADLEAAEKAAITTILTPEQAGAAFKAGAQDRNIALNQKPAYKIGQAKVGGMIDNNSGALKEQKQFAKAMGKKTGLTFILDSDLESGAIGEYDSKAGTVRISTNSNNYLQTNSHELTHFIKDYDAAGYNTYKDVVVTALMEAQSVSLEQLVNNYESAYAKQGQQLSRDEILDEIVADGTGQFLNDEKFISRVIEKDRTIAQKVIDFLNDMIDAIKSLISDKGIRAAAVGLQDNLTSYQVAREIWVESLERAGESYKGGLEKIDAEGVRFSVKETEDGRKYVEADVEQEKFDGLNTNEKLKLAEQIIMDKFRNKIIGDKPDNAFVNRDSGKEYRNPAKFLKEDLADAKARVSTELDKLMEVAKFIGHYNDDGRHPSITGGWDHYNVLFKVGGHMFEGIISVGNTEHGRVFKDLTKIKNITQGNSDAAIVSTGSSDSAEDVLNPTANGNAGLKPANRLADSESGISINSIAKTQENIKEESKKLLYQLEDVDINVNAIELMNENRTLKEANEYLTKQLTLTKDYQPRADDINKIAGKLLTEYDSTLKKDTLVKQLTKLYEYIRSSEQVDGREVTEAATAIAKTVLNHSKQADTELVDQYKTVLKDIKETSIKISETQREELDAVGGYNAFRRKYFGKLRLGNSGVDVDTAYEELSGKFPELFPADIVNQADQIIHMANVVDTIRPQIINPYMADIDEMSFIVGQQIFENYFEIRNIPPTRADKMAAQAERVKKEYTKIMSAYREEIRRRNQKTVNDVKSQARQEIKDMQNSFDNASKAQKDEYRKKIEELRNYKNIRIRAEQQLYQKRLNERRERTAAAQTRKQIIKEVTELKNWLLKPTDKKHVPEILRAPLAEFLGSIDFSSNRLNAEGEDTMRTKTWDALSKVYIKIAENGGILETGEGEQYIDVDPNLVERMDALKEQVRDIDKLENLNYYKLEEVKKTVLAMKHSIQDADKLHANKKYQNIVTLATKSLKELLQRADKLEFAGPIGGIDRLMRNEMFDSFTMFNRFGEAAESIYNGIRGGLDKKIRNTKITQDYYSNLCERLGVTQSDIRKWSGERAKKSKFSVQGGEINLTPAQVMSLYVLNKRQQAHKHIYNLAGGIKEGPTVTAKNLGIGGVNIPVAKMISKSYKPVGVTPTDVKRITDTLTSQQKEFADEIVRFFSTQTSEWGNEVSMELYGYKKFVAPNYFPIKIDRNSIAKKNENIEKSLTTLKNLGWTKPTVREANNPVIIEDILDVFTRQADQMGSYNAFVVALSDLQKYYNFNQAEVGNVQQELERTFGSNSHEFIEQLMKDINGTEKSTKDITESMIRNMKSAAVGYNLRTAIQQPTSYMRAWAEIEGKYLIKGLKVTVPESEWELCKKYAPIAQWKEWGYFDVNTGRSMKSIMTGPGSLKEQLIESSMNLAGKGDEFTWKRIWEAVKAETDDLYPELKAGTEAYYQQCGNRFSTIIDRTQVVDSVLHRSNLMKRKGLPQLYTSFMSEPTKSYNMLYRAYADAVLSKQINGKMDMKMAKRAGAVTGIWVITGMTTALAASLMDALRDDEDKELSEKYMQALDENIRDNLNPMQMIPLARDVMSIFNGYKVGRLDMQGIEYLSYAMNDLEKFIAGKSKYTLAGLANKFAKPMSMLSGVAVSNLLRDTGAVVNTMIDVFDADSAKYISKRIIYKNASSDNMTMYIKYAMKAYSEGKKSLGDRIIKDLLSAGIDTKKLDEKMRGIIKSDPIIAVAAEMRVQGDYAEYENLISEIMEDGIDKSIVVSAVKSKTEELVKAEKSVTEEGGKDNKSVEYEDEKSNEVSIYENADLKYSLENGNAEAFKEIANTLYLDKKKAGKTAVDARKDIKTYLTKQYKPQFLELHEAKNRNEKLKIQANLEKLNLGGVKLYTDTDFTKWIEEYDKAKKKK